MKALLISAIFLLLPGILVSVLTLSGIKYFFKPKNLTWKKVFLISGLYSMLSISIYFLTSFACLQTIGTDFSLVWVYVTESVYHIIFFKILDHYYKIFNNLEYLALGVIIPWIYLVIQSYSMVYMYFGFNGTFG